MENVVNLHDRRKALAQTKEDLLIQIESTKDFRVSKAAQYPDDPKSMSSANELDKLQTYVEGLPVDHLLFKTVHRTISSDSWDNLYHFILEKEHYMLGKFGFYGREDVEEFVARWAKIYGEVDHEAAD